MTTGPYQRARMIQALDLPRGPKALLMTLMTYADADGRCFPSHARLAHDMSCSEKSVRNWQAVLVERGFLKVDSGGGRHKSNRYQLTLENPVNVTDFQNGNPVSDSGNPVTVSRKPGKGYRLKEPMKEPKNAGDAWKSLRAAVRKYSAHERDSVKAAVDERTWAACQRVGGLSAIDGATDYRLNIIREQFIEEWRTG